MLIEDVITEDDAKRFVEKMYSSNVKQVNDLYGRLKSPYIKSHDDVMVAELEKQRQLRLEDLKSNMLKHSEVLEKYATFSNYTFPYDFESKEFNDRLSFYREQIMKGKAQGLVIVRYIKQAVINGIYLEDLSGVLADKAANRANEIGRAVERLYQLPNKTYSVAHFNDSEKEFICQMD